MAAYPCILASCRRIVLCGLVVIGLSSVRATSPERAVKLTVADEVLLDEIEQAAFRYFDEQSDAKTGLVRDRARADGSASEGKASVAVSGFALSGWVIATERGWVQRSVALERVRRMLRFLATKAPRQHGFFYHFMEMESGKRAWTCEVSSIDTSLLIAGALVAREYFADPQVTDLVNGLVGDLDWAWFRNGGELVALGWHDETGFSRYRWNKYSEHVLMSFLSMGTSAKPTSADYWAAWSRQPVGNYDGAVYLQEAPLFVHQFPQAYLDLRDRRDGQVDYFKNSQLATLAQRQMSIDLQAEFPLWGERLWGVTASDSATGYKAWGGPPRTLDYAKLDGTIVPCAAAGSLIFAPEETLAVLHNLRLAYGEPTWKRYGFVDAFNPHNGWVNADVLGIDQGISMVQAENLRSGLIQRLFMQSPEAQLALRKSGLLTTSKAFSMAEASALRNLAALAWLKLQTAPASAGLQLTAVVAARELGVLVGDDAEARGRAALATIEVPTTAEERSELEAALVVVGQAMPSLRGEVAAKLAQIFSPSDGQSSEALGDVGRLDVFMGIARGRLTSERWSQLSRDVVAVGPVQVLAPARVRGALRPGLWLDEREIVTGASASQLAYAQLVGSSAAAPDAATLALWLDHFPIEALHRWRAGLSRDLLDVADPDDTAALLITVANGLGGDVIRGYFQRDPLVQSARERVAEFGQKAFGESTSIIAQRELAKPRIVAARREAVATQGTPIWQEMADLSFRESEADGRAGDPPLAVRFGFTWNEDGLRVLADVTDTAPKTKMPAEHIRRVEVFVDPDNDGFEWAGARDFQFVFKPTGEAEEMFRHRVVAATIKRNANGYTVDATIPWRELGNLGPTAGGRLGVSVAVVSQGTREWEPSLKYNWSYQSVDGSHVRLGELTLQ